MIEKRFKHLKWREKRPPILPFNSYVLLEKLEPKFETQATPALAASATKTAAEQACPTAQATPAGVVELLETATVKQKGDVSSTSHPLPV